MFIKIYSILLILFLIRNFYTLYCSHYVIELISKYTKDLIDNGKYNCNINYYKEMQMPYMKYLVSILLWKKTDMIKPEYRKLIISFKKRNENKIVDIIYDEFNN